MKDYIYSGMILALGLMLGLNFVQDCVTRQEHEKLFGGVIEGQKKLVDANQSTNELAQEVLNYAQRIQRQGR